MGIGDYLGIMGLGNSPWAEDSFGIIIPR